MASVPTTHHLVWITGQPGAGKTTLGNQMKDRRGWLHFDGDIYSHGGDPISATGIPTAQMLASRDPGIGRAYKAVEQAFEMLFRNEKAPLGIWTPFYDMMCAAVLKAKQEHPTSSIIVTQSVYDADVRKYISAKLAGLQWVMLDDVADGAVKRKVQQVKDAAAAANQSVSEFLSKFDAKWSDPTNIEQRLCDAVKRCHTGLDKAQEGELYIPVVAGMTPNDVYERLCQLLGL